jgi:hypothetical protein
MYGKSGEIIGVNLSVGEDFDGFLNFGVYFRRSSGVQFLLRREFYFGQPFVSIKLQKSILFVILNKVSSIGPVVSSFAFEDFLEFLHA